MADNDRITDEDDDDPSAALGKALENAQELLKRGGLDADDITDAMTYVMEATTYLSEADTAITDADLKEAMSDLHDASELIGRGDIERASELVDKAGGVIVAAIDLA